jgi:hypothetical protein
VPDKDIARMIADTQTAKKGETRSALLAAAGETPDSDPETRRAERDAVSAAVLSGPDTGRAGTNDREKAKKDRPKAGKQAGEQTGEQARPDTDRDAKKAARKAARAAGIPTKKYAPGEEPPEVRAALAAVALRADSPEVKVALQKLAQVDDDPDSAQALARVEKAIDAAPPPHANPFMNTAEARGLGVPALKPHVAAMLASRDAAPEVPKAPKPAAPKTTAAATKAR